MGIRYDFDAGDTPVTVFESNCGDYVYYEDYKILYDNYEDIKTQFESLKDAIANLYRDY